MRPRREDFKSAADWRAVQKLYGGASLPEQYVDPALTLVAQSMPKQAVVETPRQYQDRQRRREVDRLLEKHGLKPSPSRW